MFDQRSVFDQGGMLDRRSMLDQWWNDPTSVRADGVVRAGLTSGYLASGQSSNIDQWSMFKLWPVLNVTRPAAPPGQSLISG